VSEQGFSLFPMLWNMLIQVDSRHAYFESESHSREVYLHHTLTSSQAYKSMYKWD